MHTFFKPSRLLIVIVALLTTLLSAVPVQSLTAQDVLDINNYTSWYDPNSTASDSSCATDTINGPVAAPSKIQAANTQTIIGIAKTDGLDETAAIIGVMVGLDESSLTNLANTTVKVSLTAPNAEGNPGDNFDSVGVFQQRPSTGWSTLANGAAADASQAAVFQIMTPAYAAEAFFGSPAGSNAPAALSKGLQNVSDWQSLTPWAAAQRVQQSGDPSGSNYEGAYAHAKTLVDQYWASAAAVPLPVSVTGGTPASDNGSTCASTPTDFGTGTGKFTDTNTTVESAPDGETVAEWLTRVKEASDPTSALYAQICGDKGSTNCQGLCDYLQGALWGYSSSGYETALDQWAAEVASGHGHPGDRNPPVGALLFYSSSDPAGHVAGYVGNNEVVSTDVGDEQYTHKGDGVGGVYVVPASDLEGGIWNLTYLGWSDPNFNGGTL